MPSTAAVDAPDLVSHRSRSRSNAGLLHVFHRGARKWDATSFDEHERFTSNEPIAEPTLLVRARAYVK